MTTQIVLSNPVATAVTPKPTKGEIIEAMVRLKMQEHIEAKDKANKEAEKLADELEKEFVALVQKNPAKYVATAYMGYGRANEVDGCSISFRLGKELPRPIRDKVLKYHKLTNIRVPDEKRLRDTIRQQVNMNGTHDERVQALIESPAANKALKAMLSSFNI